MCLPQVSAPPSAFNGSLSHGPLPACRQQAAALPPVFLAATPRSAAACAARQGRHAADRAGWLASGYKAGGTSSPVSVRVPSGSLEE
jgi:hypothetical protein